jgi:DNA-binding FrmR family transcriptional regulator
MGVEAVMSSPDRKQAKILRFNRIVGQVPGNGQIIKDERYCIDIIRSRCAQDWL